MENSRFVWVGEHSLLDLINTEKMQSGVRIDLLETPDDLCQWFVEAGLCTEAEVAIFLRHDEQERRAVLSEVKAFRSAMRQMADRIAEDGQVPPAAVEAINRVLAACSGRCEVTSFEDGKHHEVFQPTVTALSLLLPFRLARTASDLLCHQDLSQIRRCENPRCILYFLDTTRNHGRRWCRMDWCGNRAKAAAFYERRRRRDTAVDTTIPGGI